MARTIVIKGQCPSAKNRHIISMRGKRPVLLPNKKYAEWKEVAAWQLKGQEPVTDYPVSMTVIFYVEDNRTRDMDNMLSAITDALVHAEILADDDWKHVDVITLQFGGVDKFNARTEVWIDTD